MGYMESVNQGLSALTSVVNLFKQVRELIPKGSKQEEIDRALQDAEHQFKLAASQTASSLGYELCREHWPPEIMRSQDNHRWRCPACGNVRTTGATSVTPEQIAAWRATVDRDDFDHLQFAHGNAYATLRDYLPEDLQQEIDRWRNPMMVVASPRRGRDSIQERLLQEIARVEREVTR